MVTFFLFFWKPKCVEWRSCFLGETKSSFEKWALCLAESPHFVSKHTRRTRNSSTLCVVHHFGIFWTLSSGFGDTRTWNGSEGWCFDWLVSSFLFGPDETSDVCFGQSFHCCRFSLLRIWCVVFFFTATVRLLTDWLTGLGFSTHSRDVYGQSENSAQSTNTRSRGRPVSLHTHNPFASTSAFVPLVLGYDTRTRAADIRK